MDKEKSLTIASVFTAVLASICCIGPVVAAALGIGVLSGAGALEAWRPYLLALTAVMLGVGFYRAYRRPAGDECGCSLPARKNRKRLMWITAAIVLPLAAFPYYSGYLYGLFAVPGAPSTVAAAERRKPAELALEIDGMTCEGCARGIEAALGREPGVVEAKVDYPSKTARIRYWPEKTSPEKLTALIRELGYEPKIKSGGDEKKQ